MGEESGHAEESAKSYPSQPPISYISRTNIRGVCMCVCVCVWGGGGGQVLSPGSLLVS